MAGTFTSNYNFILQGAGDNPGTWGTTGSGGEPGLNSGIFAPLDAILGANLSVPMSLGTNSLSLANWTAAGIFVLSGALSGAASFVLPLSPNSVGSATAVGGKFIIINNTTGVGVVTVKTSATGSTGVTVPQNGAAVLYSDTVNVGYGTLGLPGNATAVNGNPNGALAGTAGSTNTNASIAWDYTNNILYICTFTGPASGAGQAVWTNPILSALTQPALQGRLTPVSNTPVLNSDSAAATTVFYTPYVGSWAAYHNTVSIVPFKFSQMQLTLTSSQAANNVYDIYLAYNGGVPVIGTGPAWSSLTSRGGSAAIQRDATSGLWVNAAIMNVTWNTGSGNTTINNVPIGQLIYLGSIFTDASAGQVSCYISWGGGVQGGPGTARKWGIWNAYNRVPILMQCGDNTTTFFNQNSGGATTWAQINVSVNSTSNLIQLFCGLAEETFDLAYHQIGVNVNGNGPIFAIGYNSTSAPVGFYNIPPTGGDGSAVLYHSYSLQPPSLGVNTAYPLLCSQGNQNQRVYPGANAMMLTSRYNG